MHRVSCPSCGAEVVFRSAASVMAVCEYCQSTLLKDAESVKDIGKMSSVLEDYSPIQLGTSGVHLNQNFNVVGRIQLRYDAGFWNEWYVLFDDGTPGWLSDASGQYVFTLPSGTVADAPPFENLHPGEPWPHDGAMFSASDVRTARCVAGQGELPFQVGPGWEAKVADFRSGPRFLTLDYSDGTPPQLYLGKAVDLTELRCQLLRDDEQIAQTAGRFRGKAESLACPNCGAPQAYRVGMATQLVCASCHAEVDCTEDQAVVLKKHAELAAVNTTLSPGDKAEIDGVDYELLGVMKCRESGEPSTWVEYLLYNAKRGFLWLVETDEGWERVTVLNDWPKSFSGERAVLKDVSYDKLYDYGAEVIYAAGAFNWRISIGDRTRITDYAKGDSKLTMEYSDSEINWSQAKPVTAQQVGTWFSKPDLAKHQAAKEKTSAGGSSWVGMRKAAKVFSILLVLLNLPIIITSGGDGILGTIAALVLLWAPTFQSSDD